jgi:WD40 repeat protein
MHTLERLLLGQVSEREAGPLEDHVERCASCFQTLKTLRVADTLVDALRRQPDGAELPLPEAAAAEDLVRRLKGLRSSPLTAKPPPAELTCTPMALDSPTHSGDGPQPLTGVLAPPQQPDEIGRLGTYRVLEVLGSGGMGVVLRAEDVRLKRQVALKVMKPEAAVKAGARERFLREAQAAAALEHENIVTVYQVGEEGGVPFLAMQWLKGLSLEERLKQAPPLSVSEVLRLGGQIARGLAAAHERGLVHRDIKPANLWLESEHGGRIRILDFGLARPIADEAHLTANGALLGTPAYMAPEQARGGPVDHRCDLFSLGVVLYRMATGQLPFRGEHALALLSALALDTPAPPRQVNPAVPAALSELIVQLLAKDPGERPQSAGEVADRLQAVERKLAAPTPAEGLTPAAPAVPRPQPSAARPLARRRLLLAAAVALLALGPLSLLLGGTVIRLATNKGELIIETDDPNLEVSIRDASATIHDEVKDRRFVLTAGDYDVEVREEGDGGVRFATKRFTITRGGQETLNARLELAKTPIGNPEGKASGKIGARLARLDQLKYEDIPPEERFDWQPKELVAVIGEHRGRQWSQVGVVAWSPNGKLVASGGRSDKLVYLWEPKTQRLLALLKGHAGRIWAAAFSPDSRMLATGGDDSTVRLWNVETCKEQACLKGHQARIWAAGFSPDGGTLATASEDHTVKLWDVRSGKELTTLREHTDAVASLAYAPDGKTLASAGYDKTIRLWDVQTRKLRATLKGHDDKVRTVAFARDGKTLASGSDDKTVRLWDVERLAERACFRGHEGWVTAVAFSPDDKTLASASYDSTLKLWDVAGQQERTTLRGHVYDVLGLAFSPDGHTLVSAGIDYTVRFWDVIQGRERSPLQGHVGPTEVVTISPAGALAASTSMNWDGVRLWDVSTRKERAALVQWRAVAIAFAPDGKKLASGGADNGVKLWDVDTGRELRTFEGHKACIRAVRFSPDGRTIASGGEDMTVKLWSADGFGNPVTLQGHANQVLSVAFSPDGKTLVSGGIDRKVCLWDVATAKQRGVLQAGGVVCSVGFAPDGKTVAFGGADQTVRLWDMTTHKETVLWGHNANVFAVTFSPDGKRLASADEEGRIVLWETSSGKKRQEWTLLGEVRSLAFAADGRHLALANGNGTVYILRLADGM